MARQFVLPDLGEGVKEGQVLRLLVGEGDRVEEDQLLMEVETDKAAVEIPSPFSGVIARWHVAEQQVVNVGDTMVTFSDGEALAPSDAASAVASTPATTPRTPRATRAPAGDRPGARTPASPAVRKLARSLGVDLASVTGTGPGGRVLRSDVEDSAGAPAAPAPANAPTAPLPAASSPTASSPNRRAASAPPAFTPSLPPGLDDTDDIGPIRREPISRTRRAIADVMSRSATIVPHVTDCDDADVTELDRLRRGYNETAPADGRLSILPFVIRALCRALQMYPIFNATFDEKGGEIIYKRYYNIAVGVQTERGLVAPVLRNVDRMTIPEIGESLARLTERARTGSVALDDTRGATYTLSNAGAMGGSRYSTPIITLPQVAVLAVGRSRLHPWVVGEEITPRLIMPLSHSMDHRIIDGAIEIAFMKQVIGDLEHPGRLLL